MSAVRTIYAGGITFDYAHMIPEHPKCGRLHGHTSHVRASVTGEIDTLGMVVDFAILKRTIESVIATFDHRFLFNRRHLRPSPTEGTLVLEYERHNGGHRIEIPEDEAVLLDGEPTIEAIADLTLALLAAEFGRHGLRFQRIEVECTEGEAKGALVSLGAERP